MIDKSHEIGGVIYPIRKNNYNLLKERSSPIYIKFLSHSSAKNPTRLRSGHYLIFYLSGANKSIIAHSKIVEVLFKKPIQIQEHHINDIQMEKEEFDIYTRNRENKSLILLKLNNIIEFENPIEIDYSISMTGMYISKESVKSFLKNI